jgi:hypothetical protein
MLLSHHQSGGQNCDIKIANRLFEKALKVHIFGNNSDKSKCEKR